MNFASILHRPNTLDCHALDAHRFCIRLQTARSDAASVAIHVCDKYHTRISDTPFEKTILRTPMKKVASTELHDFYELILFQDVICFCYFFEIKGNDKKTYYYGNGKFYTKGMTQIQDMFICAQQSRFEERLVVPSWAKGAIGYQIFPDSFSRLSAEEKSFSNWEKTPRQAKDILGGELNGITAHLDYLKDLGVDFLYLNPIFASPSPHKYNTYDYFKIDPQFGTKKDLQQLVKKAHKFGMKVILDGVFNHVGTGFFAFQDVKKKQEKSRYKDWFYIEGYPLRSEYKERPNFQTFSYFGNMPKWNTSNPEVQEYIFSVVRYWMKVAKIDGWRLDVGDEISHAFWKKFRQVVKEQNPNALIVGEVWYPATSYLQGDEWDSVMNYPFLDAIVSWIGKKELKTSEFADRLTMLRMQYPLVARDCLWNLIDSHDTPRFLSYGSEQDLKLAFALQMTLPGSPLLYYGDEVGLTGGNDPDNRRGMLWNERQKKNILQFYQQWIQLRKENELLRHGDFKVIETFNRFQVFIFSRYHEKEEIKVVVNASDKLQNNPIQGMDLVTKQKTKNFIPPKSILVIEEAK